MFTSAANLIHPMLRSQGHTVKSAAHAQTPISQLLRLSSSKQVAETHAHRMRHSLQTDSTIRTLHTTPASLKPIHPYSGEKNPMVRRFIDL